MSQYTEASVKTYPAGGALAKNLRVTRSAGLLAVADSTTAEIGTTERAAFAAQDDTPVRLRTAPGTAIFIANAAMATIGAAVYAAAAGKVAPSGTLLIGYSESAAAADGDYIEVLRV